MRYAMIMAGGSGTRLWPMSRRDRPKQLTPIIDGKSLLDLAIERAGAVVSADRTLICASSAYIDAIAVSAPKTPREFLLGEPAGRDTLNAIGFTAAVLHKHDPDAVFCVLTADHLIEPMDRFARCVNAGFDLVERHPDRLATFAITPTYAATGFGYIEMGEQAPTAGVDVHRVVRYVEKPDLETAQRLIASGKYGWNSGMFAWRADAFLNAAQKLTPEAHAGWMKIADHWGTPAQQATLNTIYPELPKISVDYAILEPVSEPGSGMELYAVSMDLSWRDVGSWPSYAETMAADEQGVAVNDAGGGATSIDCSNTLIVNDDPNHHIAVIGANDLVIVHTKDATLVMPKSHAQRLKDLHQLLPDRLT